MRTMYLILKTSSDIVSLIFRHLIYIRYFQNNTIPAILMARWLMMERHYKSLVRFYYGGAHEIYKEDLLHSPISIV